MPSYIKSSLLLVFLSLSFYEALGSHIVGGEFTYTHTGDTSIGPVIVHKYQVSLSIYEDCITGDPSAIAQDDPAYIGVFDGADSLIYMDNNPFAGSGNSAIFYSSSVTVPANFNNACVSNVQPTCLIKKTFIQTYYLAPNTTGYVVAYQRCCRNVTVANINDPSGNGATYFCVIPPAPIINNSAVFTYYPPQIICLNNPLYYDNSATDADGDSLSYDFCAASIGATTDSVKPTPLPPNIPPPNYYDSVTYISPFSSQAPLPASPAIKIDPVHGIITGTPNTIGRFLVTVCCHEWRDGTMINTIRREFQFVVQPCTKAVVADMPQFSTDPNTYIIDCKDYTVNFVNTSTGGFAYHWDFGVPGMVSDTSDDFEPAFTYPDTGTFAVRLFVNPGSTCADSITRLVKIYPYFHTDFADSGNLCPGSPIYFKDLTTSTIKPISGWNWDFGDGGNSSGQNPTHSYSSGGTYNVVLVSENIRDCSDTTLKQVIVETFQAFAGNDTTIVKGESILFNASGGISYTWAPATNLNDTAIYDPLGYYPDTGRYSYNVTVTSEYGCTGNDSITVTVVSNSEFVVPNAFTPNGDGRNDIFRPLAVGCRSVNYFRVYNRWGQRVYDANTLETGWDGTYENKQCDMGTYYWEVNYIDRFGKESLVKGDVTLIR